MALGAQLPVRLDVEIESRLESIAQRTGTTKSALIRMLAKRFVNTCVQQDGSVIFPPDIQAMLQDRDDRSKTPAYPPKDPVRYSKSKPNSKAADRAQSAGKRAASDARSAHPAPKK